MKRAIMPALMISLLLFAACGGDAAWSRKLEDMRQTLGQAEEISFAAAIRADQGETAFDCSLSCIRGSGGDMQMTFISPDFVEGVKVRTEDGERRLEYEDLSLWAGQAGGLSPAEAAPILTDALLEGHVVELYADRDGARELLALRVYTGEDTFCKLWLDGESLFPVHGEIVREGLSVIQCDFSDFSFT